MTVRGGKTFFSWQSELAPDEDVEMARWNPDSRLLTIFPRMLSGKQLEQQFGQIEALHIHANQLPGWDPESCIDENDYGNGLEMRGLPDGFSKIFRFGLGLRRQYRSVIHRIEEHSDCQVILFDSGEEGVDGAVFRLSLLRFAEFKRTVDRNRNRGTEVAARVNATAAHNSVASLLNLTPEVTSVGRHPLIQAMTRELTDQPTLNTDERRDLVRQASIESRKAVRETPLEFGRLRRDIELVSLEVLIEQFTKGMTGAPSKEESHWQQFFETNTFALQQLFAGPIALYGSQLTVKSANITGAGSRIADFLLVNPVTRGALVVEIKTPSAGLAGKKYRGSAGSEVFLPHKDVLGAVTQIQAQMESVREHLPWLLSQTPGASTLGTVDVRGAVIAGTASSLSAEEQASFLRYRGSLLNVEVVAFDEVRDRLKVLRDILGSDTSGN